MERELQAWFTSIDPRYPKGPPEMSSMVNASGSLKSVVAHHLNQPSFTTDGRSENETADESNPCIAMVMGNCFRKRESLILDHIHRRDARSEGVINYPKLVCAVHEDRTRRIMALSAAKVEIVYGRVIQQRLLQTMKCTILPLWDRFNGIFLVLIHESNFENADERYKYRRVIIFAAHPHRMFYEQIGSLVAVRQDQTFEDASLITDLKVEVDTEYYQLKKWYGKIPTPSQRAHTKARELLSLLDIEKTPEEQENEDKAKEEKADPQHGEWDIFFDDISHSNRKTRALLPAALEALYLALDQSAEDWHDPLELPDRVREWFKGQKMVLFCYSAISSKADIEFAAKKCMKLNTFKDQGEPYQLRYLLLQLMLKQQCYLGKLDVLNDDLFFERVHGSVVDNICPCGEYEAMTRSHDINAPSLCATG